MGPASCVHRAVAVRALGAEAVHISAAFSIINRIADSLGFELPSASALARCATILLKHGYEV